MLKWLARKIGRYAIKNALLDLNKDNAYLLITDLPDSEIQDLREAVSPLFGKVNMVIVSLPRFYLFQFEGSRGSEVD